MGKATGTFTSLGTPSWGSVRICGLPGGAECTVGNKAPAYFGTIPRTRLFLGVLISSAHWEEKNCLKAEEKKREPPKKTRDSIKKQAEKAGWFPLQSQKHFNWQAPLSTELWGLSDNCYCAAVRAVFTYTKVVCCAISINASSIYFPGAFI